MARRKRRLAKTKTNKQVVDMWKRALDKFANDMNKSFKKLK